MTHSSDRSHVRIEWVAHVNVVVHYSMLEVEPSRPSAVWQHECHFCA